MPSGPNNHSLGGRSTPHVVDEAPLSSSRSQKEIAASSFGENAAAASLLGLYLAHEWKATRRPGRYQEPNPRSAREEGRVFDRAALNKFIRIANELYRKNAISSDQYSKAIRAVTSMYVEQFASMRLDSYLEKISCYITKAFREMPF